MSMHLDEFLNYCESLIDSYLDWIIDPSSREQNWSKNGSGIYTGRAVIEEFLLRTDEFFDTESFKLYSGETAFKLLSQLHHKIDDYHSNPSTMFNVTSKEKLLADKNWIEIQELGKKVKQSLEQFIAKGRNG